MVLDLQSKVLKQFAGAAKLLGTVKTFETELNAILAQFYVMSILYKAMGQSPLSSTWFTYYRKWVENAMQIVGTDTTIVDADSAAKVYCKAIANASDCSMASITNVLQSFITVGWLSSAQVEGATNVSTCGFTLEVDSGISPLPPYGLCGGLLSVVASGSTTTDDRSTFMKKTLMAAFPADCGLYFTINGTKVANPPSIPLNPIMIVYGIVYP